MNLSDQKINFSWQLSLILFLLISPMFFGPLIALLNPEFFEGLGDNDLSLGSTLFVARNLAIGVAFFCNLFEECINAFHSDINKVDYRSD